MGHVLAASPNPVEAPAMGGAGLRAFLRLAEVWRLSTNEQIRLLGVPRSTFFKWKKEASGDLALPRDTLERLSYVLGIYKALHVLFPDPDVANTWIRLPNQAPLFGGRSALQRMLAGQVGDLFVVRQYLDAQRGW